MKMNQTPILKAIGLLAFCIPLILGCQIPFQNKMDTPVPEENPVYFSANQRSRIIKVDNLYGIIPMNSSDIKIIDDMKYTITIKNEWIELFHQSGNNRSDQLIITVTKNTTGKERSYVVGLDGIGKKSSLTIIQKEN